MYAFHIEERILKFTVGLLAAKSETFFKLWALALHHCAVNSITTRLPPASSSCLSKWGYLHKKHNYILIPCEINNKLKFLTKTRKKMHRNFYPVVHNVNTHFYLILGWLENSDQRWGIFAHKQTITFRFFWHWLKFSLEESTNYHQQRWSHWHHNKHRGRWKSFSSLHFWVYTFSLYKSTCLFIVIFFLHENIKPSGWKEEEEDDTFIILQDTIRLTL